MKVTMTSVSEIKPYDRNPRKNEAAIDAVANSLREFGFRKPIVVDDQGVIIAGHTCFAAAQKLGLAKVPVHVASELSEDQVRAYRLVDNRVSELADWDLELMKAEMQGLIPIFDLENFGFQEIEIEMAAIDDLAIMKGDAQEPWDTGPNIDAPGRKAVWGGEPGEVINNAEPEYPKIIIQFDTEERLEEVLNWIKTQDASWRHGTGKRRRATLINVWMPPLQPYKFTHESRQEQKQGEQ